MAVAGALTRLTFDSTKLPHAPSFSWMVRKSFQTVNARFNPLDGSMTC